MSPTILRERAPLDDPFMARPTNCGAGTIRFFPNLEQGSLEWMEARRGLLTASEMHHIITPKTLKAAANDKERSHLYELLAQRISGYVEPSYISDDMLRGLEDEMEARALYAKTYAPVETMGFITNDRFGFTIGYSPDGLVGDDGQIECKSRRQKYQVQTIIEHAGGGADVPMDFIIQVQTGLLVTEREWCDLVSYSAGLPMITLRCYPVPEVLAAIEEAAAAFEDRLLVAFRKYGHALASNARLIPTKRKTIEEIVL